MQIKIQNNTFNSTSIPTTQEDNHFGINARWDLFSEFGEGSKPVGKLVQYYTGRVAFIQPQFALRFDFSASDVSFITFIK